MTRDKELLAWMFSRQDKLNRLISGSAWRGLYFPWYRPVWHELSEMLGYLTRWQWWKGAEEDMDSALLELIDAWHFAMSGYMQYYSSLEFEELAEKAMEDYYLAFPTVCRTEDVVELTEDYMAECIKNQAIRSLTGLFAISISLGYGNIEKIHSLYRGKAVLNEFRSKHGYKQGTYTKLWDGKEDNLYLIRLLKEYDKYPGDDVVYRRLEEKYKEVRNGN